MKRLLLISLIALLPNLAQAEAYICRTSTRSCAFSVAGALPDGTACHCATQGGLVNGYSMPDPTSSPQLARPKPLPVSASAPITTSGNAECFRGIGNCPESYGATH